MNNLKSLRQNMHLTLRELAEKINIDKSTLSRYERDEQEIKSSDLTIFCSFFNVSSDYLLGLSNDRNSENITSAKDQLKGVKLALYNQTESLTEEQAEDVLQFINFIKSKGEK